MGMEDKYGRATYMESGHVMETKDGKKIIMNGNEIWRVDELLHKYHRGSKTPFASSFSGSFGSRSHFEIPFKHRLQFLTPLGMISGLALCV